MGLVHRGVGVMAHLRSGATSRGGSLLGNRGLEHACHQVIVVARDIRADGKEGGLHL